MATLVLLLSSSSLPPSLSFSRHPARSKRTHAVTHWPPTRRHAGVADNDIAMETARGSSATPHALPLFVAPWRPQLLASFTLSRALLFAPSRPSCPLHAVALLAPSRSSPHRAPRPITPLSARRAPVSAVAPSSRPSRHLRARRPFAPPTRPYAPPSRPCLAPTCRLCALVSPLRTPTSRLSRAPRAGAVAPVSAVALRAAPAPYAPSSPPVRTAFAPAAPCRPVTPSPPSLPSRRRRRLGHCPLHLAPTRPRRALRTAPPVPRCRARMPPSCPRAHLTADAFVSPPLSRQSRVIALLSCRSRGSRALVAHFPHPLARTPPPCRRADVPTSSRRSRAVALVARVPPSSARRAGLMLSHRPRALIACRPVVLTVFFFFLSRPRRCTCPSRACPHTPGLAYL
ncbi:hypothetical protein DENSPDRAFT_934391 [Dentipellis sp. KUC8613]|nr:hypothetical protein DENSPDRAFT_934391 [Dentipellis sp. KUC8613]